MPKCNLLNQWFYCGSKRSMGKELIYRGCDNWQAFASVTIPPQQKWEVQNWSFVHDLHAALLEIESPFSTNYYCFCNLVGRRKMLMIILCFKYSLKLINCLLPKLSKFSLLPVSEWENRIECFLMKKKCSKIFQLKCSVGVHVLQTPQCGNTCRDPVSTGLTSSRVWECGLGMLGKRIRKNYRYIG